MPRNAMVISKLWAQASVLTFLLGFTGLGILAALIYARQPPRPARVLAANGESLFTGEDIVAGQQLFQRRELMQFGTIYGHGAYLGPDFTAQYLHRAASSMLSFYEQQGARPDEARAQVVRESKDNAYDPGTDTLTFTAGQAHAFQSMRDFYREYFGPHETQRGLKRPAIADPGEIHQLTAFFAWAAWTASARRPDAPYSYTNDWPGEPLVGNFPTAENFFWSVVSLISLLAGIGLVLYLFGRYQVLGWHRADEQGQCCTHKQTGDNEDGKGKGKSGDCANQNRMGG